MIRGKTLAGLVASAITGALVLFSPVAAHAATHPAEPPSFGRANLVSYDDSDFENNLGTWVAVSGTAISQDTTKSFLHNDSLKLTATAAGSQASQAMGAPLNNGISVTAGNVYRLSAWVKTGSAVSGRSVTLSAGFSDVNGTFLSRVNTASQTLSSTTGWQYVSGTVTAPASATQMVFGPRVTESGVISGEVLNVDEVMVLPYRAAVALGGKDPSGDGSDFSVTNSAIGPDQVDKLFYSGSLPSSYAGSNCGALQDSFPNVTCVEAYKTPDTNVASFVSSIPAGRNVVMVFHQEPEGDGFANGPDGCNTGNAAGNFVCEQKAQSNLIRGAMTAANRENVFVAQDSASFPYETGQTATGCNWITPTAYIDFYFMDLYENTAPGTNVSTVYRNKWANWIGCVGPQNKPLGFGEYGLNGLNAPDYANGATTPQALAADNTYLAGQSFAADNNGTPNGIIYNLPVVDWMYWWHAPDGTYNWQFTTGTPPDGTQAVNQWVSNETQNGGGAN